MYSTHTTDNHIFGRKMNIKRKHKDVDVDKSNSTDDGTCTRGNLLGKDNISSNKNDIHLKIYYLDKSLISIPCERIPYLTECVLELNKSLLSLKA